MSFGAYEVVYFLLPLGRNIIQLLYESREKKSFLLHSFPFVVTCLIGLGEAGVRLFYRAIKEKLKETGYLDCL